jgi:DNA modification methylase
MTEPRSFLDGRVMLYAGDCRLALKDIPDNSVDAVCTDPPYALVSIGKRFGKDGAAPAKSNGATGIYARASKGFMGVGWDHGAVAFDPELWVDVLRCMKPGAHGLAMGGTRTFHRLVCAIEDAGAEIRDTLVYAFGSGFPKSLSVSKQLDKMAGVEREVIGKAKDFARDGCNRNTSKHRNERDITICDASGRGWDSDITSPATDAAREWDGWGTAMKPAVELICMFRKPLSEPNVAANVLRWGTGAINVAACKVPAADGITNDGRPYIPNYGNNVFGRGMGGGNAPVSSDGRWPANLLHDNSEEVLACFPETGAAIASAGRNGRDIGDVFSLKRDADEIRGHDDNGGSAARFFASFPQDDENKFSGSKISGDIGPTGLKKRSRTNENIDDSGSQARFFASFPQDDVQRIFYTSKAGQDDRLGSSHPTVKPLDLIQYLVRLVTPKNGTCLDLFAGTGTTAEACFREGFRCILIEREAEYIKDIERRMSLVMEGQDTRKYASMKARNRPRDDGPLFGGSEDPPRHARPTGCIRNGDDGPFGYDGKNGVE